MSRRPPTSPPFPYTTLFRSEPAHLGHGRAGGARLHGRGHDIGEPEGLDDGGDQLHRASVGAVAIAPQLEEVAAGPYGADRKSTRLNSSHLGISYAVFCLKKK